MGYVKGWGGDCGVNPYVLIYLQILKKSLFEIRVVLWPQSTKTSVGPPDISMWWSGGLLKIVTIKNSILIKKM